MEAILKFKSTRNLHEANFEPDLHENTQDNSIPKNEDAEFQYCQEFHNEQDMETLNDDLLDFMHSQCHTDDKLDQVKQPYQAYSESQPSKRIVNVHITYHVAQPDQA